MAAKRGTMTTAVSKANPRRHDDLKRMLEECRLGMATALRSRIRDVRADGPAELSNDGEDGHADMHEDVEFALIQMKVETLTRVSAALVRLEAGEYGDCLECGAEIAEKRLRALPFALRCKSCEEARELALDRARQVARQRGGPLLFAFAASR